MAPTSDYALGQKLAQSIQPNGATSFEAGIVDRRLLAQLQDLIGADTILLNPLRDLLQRPGFQQLIGLKNQGQLLSSRDALLQDLAQVYSPAVLRRLEAVLQGCLNLPAPAPTPAAPLPTPPTSSPAATATVVPMPAPPATVISNPNGHRGHGATTILIALLALICGAMVMAIAAVLITTSRSNNGTTTPVPVPTPESQPATLPPVAPSTPAMPSADEAPPAAAASGQWQACLDYASNEGTAPQAGETWWPVVGPAEALEASRQHCRADAFINGSGNVQIASFRDRSTAETFAQQLSSDNSHPYGFRVGEPTVR